MDAPPCPDCGAEAHTRPLVYGKPTELVLAAAERHEVVLAGCAPMPAAPSWACLACGLHFHTP